MQALLCRACEIGVFQKTSDTAFLKLPGELIEVSVAHGPIRQILGQKPYDLTPPNSMNVWTFLLDEYYSSSAGQDDLASVNLQRSLAFHIFGTL
jgi:hypothetical protein